MGDRRGGIDDENKVKGPLGRGPSVVPHVLVLRFEDLAVYQTVEVRIGQPADRARDDRLGKLPLVKRFDRGDGDSVRMAVVREEAENHNRPDRLGGVVGGPREKGGKILGKTAPADFNEVRDGLEGARWI
jgi:hypothetical protein